MNTDLRTIRWAAVALAGFLAACSPVTGTDSNTNLQFRERVTPNFLFVYTSRDAPTLDALTADMDAKLARLKTKLRVDTLPRITVVLYPSRAAFQEANNSANWVPGVTRGVSRIEMISPYAVNQVYELWPDTRAEHMLAHIVSLGVNGNAGNNPRWLWESLALYESGQKSPPTKAEFFKPGAEPALSQLGGGYGTPIFDVGYYLGEFLETTFGMDKVIELVEAEGNLSETLGLTGSQFVAQFVAFVRQKYNLPSQ